MFGWHTLDSRAIDMDDFGFKLLGETWAYVTIVLVGRENCPHHHSHAIELEGVSEVNPHVGFFDVHGRECERVVVEDILSGVYQTLRSSSQSTICRRRSSRSIRLGGEESAVVLYRSSCRINELRGSRYAHLKSKLCFNANLCCHDCHPQGMVNCGAE